MQSLTNDIEATIALQEVTNVMKPIEATYQAAMQVKMPARNGSSHSYS